jgi:hypothetical protein
MGVEIVYKVAFAAESLRVYRRGETQVLFARHNRRNDFEEFGDLALGFG